MSRKRELEENGDQLDMIKRPNLRETPESPLVAAKPPASSHADHRVLMGELVDVFAPCREGINTIGKDGFTILHRACQSGHHDLVEALLDRGAEFIRGSGGVYPLHVACAEGYLPIVEMLIDRFGHNKDCKCCSFNNFYSSKRFPSGVKSCDSWTPLHFACFYGHRDISALLIRRSASMTSRTDDDYTPLLLACMRGHRDVVELCLDQGVHPTELLRGSFNALHIACWFSHQNVVDLLLARGCDPHLKIDQLGLVLSKFVSTSRTYVKCKESVDGWTLLHLASFNGDQGIAKSLLTYGADIEAVTRKGRTPLHLACSQGRPSVIEFLLSQGADAHRVDQDGCSPLTLLRDWGTDSLVCVVSNFPVITLGESLWLCQFFEKRILFNRFNVNSIQRTKCSLKVYFVVKCLVEHKLSWDVNKMILTKLRRNPSSKLCARATLAKTQM